MKHASIFMKTATLLLVVLISGLLSNVTLLANQSVTITNSENVMVSENATFEMDVIMENASHISSFQLILKYDETLFEMISIQKGAELVSSLVSNIDVAGEINVNYSDISSPFSGDVVLFTVTMKVIGQLDDLEIDLFEADEDYTEILQLIGNDFPIVENINYAFNPVIVGMYGDVNLDGRVSIADAMMIQLYLANRITFTDLQMRLADVNLDERISIADAMMIQLYLAGRVDYLGPIPGEDPEPDNYPLLSGVIDKTIDYGTPFDPLEGVHATDEVDGDLTTSITVTGEVDVNVPGVYILTYRVGNSLGNVTEVTRIITVKEDLSGYVYAQGYYNFRYADADLRNTLFAYAEAYILTKMYGGIPLFTNSGFALYHERLDLPVEEHVPVMGWAATRSVFTQDDAEAFGGVAGRYTYRSILGGNPDTFHHWRYQDTPDVISHFLDSLYYFELNEDRDGYVVLPSMASSDPVPINPNELDTGIITSKVWQIPLRDDLKWTFHPDTDTTGLSSDINALDFVDTYKLAMEQEWFRTGVFTNAPQEIVNAQSFIEGKVDFEDVGIKVIDDTTIEFTFIENISEWEVKYWLTSFVLTPIHLGLYDLIGNDYGTSPETTAYHGFFMLDNYQANKEVNLSPNPNFHSKDRYPSMTHYTYYIIDDEDVALEEYLKGNLEVLALTNEQYSNYYDHADGRFIPGATTFRLNINATKTLEGNKAAYHGNFDTDYVPEPILAYEDFRWAMYYAIDRATLAWDILKTSTPQPYYFSAAYMVEPESGMAFRHTEQAKIVDDMIPGLYDDEGNPTYGFNPELALAYWKSAIDAAIADGFYVEGETIELELYIFSGSDAQVSFGNFIKESFEGIFQGYRGVKVEVNVTPKPFPSIYFDYMMMGEFDLAIGGISGSTLNAPSFLDVFIDDNRNGFTLNWGIDTTSPILKVDYELGGELIQEIWSFNALVSALNGEVYVENGLEAKLLGYYGNFEQLHNNTNLDDEISIIGVVTTVYEDGYFVFDGENYINVYRPNLQEGDIVEGNRVLIVGRYSHWYNLYQISHVTKEVILVAEDSFEETIHEISIKDLVNQNSQNRLIPGRVYRITGTVDVVNENTVHIVDEDQNKVLVSYKSEMAKYLALLEQDGEEVTMEIVYHVLHPHLGLMVFIKSD